MKRNISSFLLCLLSVCMILCGGLRTGIAGGLYSAEAVYQNGGAGQHALLTASAARPDLSAPGDAVRPDLSAPGDTARPDAEVSLTAPGQFPAIAVPGKTGEPQTGSGRNIQGEGSYSFRGAFSGGVEETAEALSFSVLGALLFTLLLISTRSLFCPHLLVQARILSFIHSQDGLK